MCSGLVILASSLSRTRRNVNRAEIRISTHKTQKISVIFINTQKDVDSFPLLFYTRKVSLRESHKCRQSITRHRSSVIESRWRLMRCLTLIHIRLTGKSYSICRAMRPVMLISKTCQILLVGDSLSVVGVSN